MHPLLPGIEAKERGMNFMHEVERFETTTWAMRAIEEARMAEKLILWYCHLILYGRWVCRSCTGCSSNDGGVTMITGIRLTG